MEKFFPNIATAIFLLSGFHPAFGEICTMDSLETSKDLVKNLKLLRLDCGQVCDTTVHSTSRGKYYDYLEKEVDCLNLFESSYLEGLETVVVDDLTRPLQWCEMPKHLRDHFTYDDTIKADFAFINNIDWSVEKVIWTQSIVEEYKTSLRNGDFKGPYGKEEVNKIQRHLEDHMGSIVKGGNLLVIGSQTPWIEAMLLNLGAANVTTLEYNPIISEHPQIRVISPKQMNEMVLSGELGPDGRQFDGVVTFSSLEHSGLGRYGDRLNPWADLITMAKAWCVTRTGGRSLVGVPTGTDKILFNACRRYGYQMFPHLFANWNLIYTEAKIDDSLSEACGDPFCYQPPHILEKL